MPKTLLINRFEFDALCGCCKKFLTNQCPHLNEVLSLTRWKAVKCNKFKTNK